MSPKKKRVTGGALRSMRRALGLTQEALGEALDVDAQTISNWERGVTRVPVMAGLAVAYLAQREGA